MNIRTNQPIQYRIEVIHEKKDGQRIYSTFNYGFPSEPDALKVKITARTLASGISRTIKGAEFIAYEAVRIER